MFCACVRLSFCVQLRSRFDHALQLRFAFMCENDPYIES